ncbi:hypothetical protein JYU34_020615 [Plutella xylostella]|uniref:Peptidase S1 domain-containing protein n=1 Tax=Plutella xylostella TaxID=51655 RepID=A0ABQ7PUR2_PLUXY|nr:hypothetical protein JYU34_020615 [Plutella xylostella]
MSPKVSSSHSLNTAEFSVRAGSSSNRRGGQVIQVSDMLWHSGANAQLDNDIALLLLASPLQYNSKVTSIPLQSQNETMIGDKAIISGWGSLSEDGASPETLQMATVPLVSLEACQRSYSSILPVTLTMICAGVVDGGRDSCQGDSGGPLVVNSVLVGIVAGGLGCGRAGYPGVYTRVRMKLMLFETIQNVAKRE